jgi:hypothetical protein
MLNMKRILRILKHIKGDGNISHVFIFPDYGTKDVKCYNSSSLLILGAFRNKKVLLKLRESDDRVYQSDAIK